MKYYSQWKPALAAVGVWIGAGFLVFGMFCAAMNTARSLHQPLAHSPKHYVMVEELYRCDGATRDLYKGEVLEELDECYKIKIVDFYYKLIQPDEIWILKSGKDSGEFHLIWDSAPAPATVPYPETIICSTGTFKSNGGTLPTSHNY